MATGTDVKLVPGQVRVEAWDLCVDAADRRKSTTPHRRALVHDFDDGLTVNWAGDYPGGVTVNGTRVRVNGKLEIVATSFGTQTVGTGTSGPPTATRSGTAGRVVGTGASPQALAESTILAKYLGSGPIDVAAALSKIVLELDSVKQQLAKLNDS